MKILVLNGSPKGDYSITLHSLKFIAKRMPHLDFEILNVGTLYRKYETDFSEALEKLNEAELIIFSYPVYTCIAPFQLHRFIEQMKENGVNLKGKYATQITTSKHFYDMTAHRFIEDNCADFEMKYIKGLSSDMEDLPTTKGQEDALSWMKFVEYSYNNDIYENPSATPSVSSYQTSENISEPDMAGKTGDTVIVTDLAPEDLALKNMINKFRTEYQGKTRIFNIHDFKFKGGCVSCFSCASEGECIYDDGFEKILRDEIQTSEAIVIAFTIKDHSMGSKFKNYDDRQFCNGHRTVTMGTPFAYIVNGDLSKEENLKTIIEARTQVGGNYLAGIINDASDIRRVSSKLKYAVENKFSQPANFYGVGGMKIFRDLIYLMQGLMRADYKFYKKHGQLDFPQKKRGKIMAMYAVGYMMNNKKIRQKAGYRIKDGMIASHKKVVDNA